MTCPFGRKLKGTTQFGNCPGWPEICPCRDELLAHAAGNADDQTAHLAAWWCEHLDPDGCDTWKKRTKLPQFR